MLRRYIVRFPDTLDWFEVEIMADLTVRYRSGTARIVPADRSFVAWELQHARRAGAVIHRTEHLED